MLHALASVAGQIRSSSVSDAPSETIPPNPDALEEALSLAADILKDIELSRISLASTALKASRLARLLNHFDYQSVFQYEASGYPSTPTGVPNNIWHLIMFSGRTYLDHNPTTKALQQFAFLESVDQLEQMIEAGKLGLQAAEDRDISITSANPQQYIVTPMGNTLERQRLQNQISQATQRLANRRAFIYQYASRCLYELKFSGVAENVFSAVRAAVDRGIGDVVPGAVQKFASVYDNLRSQNPEDWSNAVHSCRRIVQDLANAVFPPQKECRTLSDGKRIELGADQYINRLACFAQDNSSSALFSAIVGSHLRYLGDRLDAIFDACQKGSHAVVARNEANRYVVYTYMLVGDILTLFQETMRNGQALGASAPKPLGNMEQQ